MAESLTVRELVANLGFNIGDGFARAEAAFSRLQAFGEATTNALEQKLQKSLAGNDLSVGIDKAAESIKRLQLGAIAAGAAIAYGVARWVSSVSDANAELARNQVVTLASAKELQGWSHAARLNGASAEDITSAWVTLNDKIYAASKGEAGAVMALGRLGVGLRNNRGQLKSQSEILEAVADKFQKMPDGVKKLGIANDALGESGKRLIPLLNQGGAAVRAQRIEFEQLRGVTEEQAEQDRRTNKDYRQSLVRLEAVYNGFKESVAGPVIETLGRVQERFVAWVKTQAKEKNAGARAGFDQLAKFGNIALLVLQKLYTAGTFMAKWIDVVAIGIGALIATPIIIWVGTLVAALVAGGAAASAAWALVFLKFLAIATIVAGAALIVEDFLTFLRGGDSVLGRLIKQFNDWVNNDDPSDSFLIRFVKELIRLIGDEIPMYVRALGSIFSKVFDEIGEVVKSATGWITNAVQPVNDLLDKANVFLARKLAPISHTASEFFAPGFTPSTRPRVPTVPAGGYSPGDVDPSAVSSQPGGSSGVTVHGGINISGVSDPEEAARRVRKDFEDLEQKRLRSLRK
jgi:hypothetical protein